MIFKSDVMLRLRKTSFVVAGLIGSVLSANAQASSDVYYVKEKGTGDGSSWETAMGPESFAKILPIAPKGSVFHVAEGIYRPMYDGDGEASEKTSKLTFKINDDVTIMGGYPDNATDLTTRDFKTYATVFSGDINGDDEVDLAKLEKGSNVSYLNREDNVSILFLSNKEDGLNVVFDGVSLNNAGSALTLLENDKKLTLKNCNLTYNNTAVVMPYAGDEATVDNSVFFGNTAVFNMPNSKKLDLNDVTFTSNAGSLVQLVATPEDIANVNMKNVLASNNNGGFQIINSNLDVQSSKFSYNDAINMFYISGANTTAIINTSDFLANNSTSIVLNYQTSDLQFTGCTFAVNTCTSAVVDDQSNHKSLDMSQCKFDGNTCGTLVHVIGDHINVSECTFANNNGVSLLDAMDYISANVSKCLVDNNTFSKEIFIYNGGNEKDVISSSKSNSVCNNTCEKIFYCTSGTSVMVMSNNTVASNTVSDELLDASGVSVRLFNNTIIGNQIERAVSHLTAGDLTLIGNIILGNVSSIYKTELITCRWTYVDKSSVKYNVIPYVEFIDDLQNCEEIKDIMSENICSVFNNDKVSVWDDNTCPEFSETPNNNDLILTSLFAGAYDNTSGLFTPQLTDVTPLAKMAVLKSDMSALGSVRFPLDQTTVSLDQRGYERPKSACMGAYEIGDLSDLEIVEKENDKVLFYPNPATDRVVLNNTSDAQYVIYNALGQKVMMGVSEGSEINVSALSAGIYRLDVINVGQGTLMIRK